VTAGGPNLDTKLLEPPKLLSLGFNSSEISIIHDEDCRVMYPSYGTVHVPKHNVTWSTAGFSEFFLKRKLKLHGHDITRGNVVLMPFFTYLVRLPFKPMCFYLDPGYFIR
jgi:hypothetical protein